MVDVFKLCSRNCVVSDSHVLIPIKVRVSTWVLDGFGLLISTGFMGGWMWVNWPNWNLAVFVNLTFFLCMFFGFVWRIAEHARISKVAIANEGLVRMNKDVDVLFRWEDVTRCEPFKAYTRLFFENGNSDQNPARRNSTKGQQF